MKLREDMFILIGGRALQAVLAIFSIRILTEILPAEEVGHQYVINSMTLWFGLVLINPVGMFTNRYIHEWTDEKALYQHIRALNVYFLLISLLAVPVSLGALYFFNFGQDLEKYSTVFFIAAYVYFSTWFTVLVSFFNLLNYQKIFVTLNLAGQICGLIMAYVGVQYSRTALMWMSGLLGGQIIALTAAFIFFSSVFPVATFSHNSRSAKFWSRETFYFCYPIAVTTFFMWFLNQGYRLVIEQNLGAVVLASIGVGLSLATSVAGVVEAIVMQYFYPGYYSSLLNSDTAKRRSAWQALWDHAVIIYIPFCFLIFSCSHLIVRVLVAAEYQHVYRYMFFGAFIELARQCSNIAYLVPHGEKKTMYTMIPYSAGAFVLALLVFYFIGSEVDRTIDLILLSLLLAGWLVCWLNLKVAKRLIGVGLDWKLIGKVTGLSIFLLLPVWKLTEQSALWALLLGAFYSVCWCGMIIIFFSASLKKKDT